jgi:uncharacterized protein (TIGR02145 family)
MKKFIILFVLFPGMVICQSSMTFTFTAVNDSSYFQLDSIKIKNLTQGGDTVLVYPDTILSLNYVGLYDNPGLSSDIRALKNYPNPVKEWSTIRFYTHEKDRVMIKVTDILGRTHITSEKVLDQGQHFFRFTPSGEKIYLLNIRWRETNTTIKILNMGLRSGSECFLEYTGSEMMDLPMKANSAIQQFPFSPGDELLHIGYAEGLESGIYDTPEASQDYTFQFATNIPCPGMDSLYYEGQWYHTIQIFSQCWMMENMNVGTMIPYTQDQTDNQTIEKYCLGDMSDFCDTYGGLYFWNEMMNYVYENNGQGICPEGWHIPGDVDWQILEGAVDSANGIGSDAWRYYGWRGADAGGNLKEKGTSHWAPPNTGATDNFGFSALPAGYFVQNAYWGLEYKTYLWSSDPNEQYYRNIDWNQAQVRRDSGGDEAALSVRCIRD